MISPCSARSRAFWVASLLLVGGCFGGSNATKPVGSALWLAADSGELTSVDQGRLAEVGLKEVFLDAGELGWSGRAAVRRLDLPRIPRRTPVTLSIRGNWLPGDEEPLSVAETLLGELLAMRIEAEQAGYLVVGFHFEIDSAERSEHYAKTLKALRRKLDGKAFLSAGFRRRDLGGESAQAIASGCDFVTCFLYGQVPGEAEDAEAWDLQAVEQSFRKLEALGRPYLTGAITLGSATLLRKGRNAERTTTELSLGDLVARRALELKPGFSLQGIDRQLFEFVAQEPVQVGAFDLARGDSVRVVRTATPLVEEFRRRVGAWESPNRLGEIYYRLPRPTEKLSLSTNNLVTVLGPASASPELALALERTLRSADRWIVRASLENRGDESSDLAFFDNNYVEVTVEGGVFLDADPGEFRRVDLLHDGQRGTMQALRAANQVRLSLPLLEGHQRATSGGIVLRVGESRPVVRISASFLLPDGHMLNTDPIEWSFEAP